MLIYVNVGSLKVKVLLNFFYFSSNFTRIKNVQIDEAAMTDTLRGNNLLMPSRASNPNMRIKREASTEKIHSNYGNYLILNDS